MQVESGKEAMTPILGNDTEGIPFIQIGHHVLRLDLEDLDDHYKERAKCELRETPEKRKESLDKFKKLIEDEPNLVIPLDDDSYLLKFLRPCKFYEESAFKRMQRYYRFMAKNTKYTSNLMPSTVETVYANEIIEFLPFRVKGSRVMILNIKNWNPKDVGVPLLFKSIIMALEIAMIEPRTQVGGVHVILDMEGFTINHVMQFSPMVAKMIMDFVQDCAATRLKGIHVVNQPYVFNMAYQIFKPFIGQKLKSRLHFHGNKWENLVDLIPKDFLLQKYGGSLELNLNGVGELLVEVLKYYEADYEKLTHFGYGKELQVEQK